MKRSAWIAAGFLVASMGSAAADLPFPTVSFAGEAKLCQTVEAKDECIALAIFYTPARWRVEQTDQTGRTVLIYDMSKKTVTTIEFGQKIYSVTPFNPNSDEINVGFLPGRGEFARVGEEAVNGAPAIKYKMAKTQDALRAEAFVWVNGSNIVVRLHATITDNTNKASVAFRFEVTKLTVGAVDPAMLDVAIPSDFKKADQ